MLELLHIENIAVIQEADIQFRPGFNALTGEIVNVSVDERALDENGKLAVEKLHIITFDYANHGYYVLGEKVASAFEDGKKFK